MDTELQRIRDEIQEYEDWQDELLNVYEDEQHDLLTRRIAKQKIKEIEEQILPLQEKAFQLQQAIDQISNERANLLTLLSTPQVNQAQQKRGKKL